MIGSRLEKAGWRQGSIVRSSDLAAVLETAGVPYERKLLLITASQSCDIANNKIEIDPMIELSLARRIEAPKPHLLHNKNPRILHTHLLRRTGNVDVASDIHIELKAFERFAIAKEVLKDLIPDFDLTMEERHLTSYVAWLAARYSRPALPTAFNDRIKAADPKDKLRDKAKKGSEQLVGIYVEILPDAEIRDDESYRINLLGLLPGGFEGDVSRAESAITAYADVMQKAGMDVTKAVRTEDEVSLSIFRRFRRFYYDDLSIKDETPMPPEAG